ncbi:hypothetical protein COB57_02385 [Candidatus Peregrinibacteria bacterium]|nr:MAG: hypothetical protein COB57_02385 [Candidatus Peregrinibacteria bacterium]
MSGINKNNRIETFSMVDQGESFVDEYKMVALGVREAVKNISKMSDIEKKLKQNFLDLKPDNRDMGGEMPEYDEENSQDFWFFLSQSNNYSYDELPEFLTYGHYPHESIVGCFDFFECFEGWASLRPLDAIKVFRLYGEKILDKIDVHSLDRRILISIVSQNLEFSSCLNSESRIDPFLLKIMTYRNFHWKSFSSDVDCSFFAEKTMDNSHYFSLLRSNKKRVSAVDKKNQMKVEMEECGPSFTDIHSYSSDDYSGIRRVFQRFPRVKRDLDILEMAIRFSPKALYFLPRTLENVQKSMRWNDQVFFLLPSEALESPGLYDQIWEDRKDHIRDMLYEYDCGMRWLQEVIQNKKKFLCHVDFLFEICHEDRGLVKKVLNICLILNLEVSDYFFDAKTGAVITAFISYRDLVERYSYIQEDYRYSINEMVEMVCYARGPLTYVYYKAYYRMMNDIFSGFADVNNMSKYMYEMFDDKVFLEHFEAGKLDDFEKYCKEL